MAENHAPTVLIQLREGVTSVIMLEATWIISKQVNVARKLWGSYETPRAINYGEAILACAAGTHRGQRPFTYRRLISRSRIHIYLAARCCPVQHAVRARTQRLCYSGSPGCYIHRIYPRSIQNIRHVYTNRYIIALAVAHTDSDYGARNSHANIAARRQSRQYPSTRQRVTRRKHVRSPCHSIIRAAP